MTGAALIFHSTKSVKYFCFGIMERSESTSNCRGEQTGGILAQLVPRAAKGGGEGCNEKTLARDNAVASECRWASKKVPQENSKGIPVWMIDSEVDTDIANVVEYICLETGK